MAFIVDRRDSLDGWRILLTMSIKFSNFHITFQTFEKVTDYSFEKKDH